MTSAPDLQALFDRCELTKADAARIMGRDIRNVRRWFDKGPPPDVPQLLAAVAEICDHTGWSGVAVLERLYGRTQK